MVAGGGTLFMTADRFLVEAVAPVDDDVALIEQRAQRGEGGVDRSSVGNHHPHRTGGLELADESRLVDLADAAEKAGDIVLFSVEPPTLSEVFEEAVS